MVVVDLKHPVLIREGIKYKLQVKLCRVDGAQYNQILTTFAPRRSYENFGFQSLLCSSHDLITFTQSRFSTLSRNQA